MLLDPPPLPRRWRRATTTLTFLDVPQSLSLALHPDALPVAGSLQVEGGDEG